MPQQIIPLTDDELMAVADDPDAQGKFTSEERRRLNRLRAQSPQKTSGPDGAGYWEDLGIAGKRWHPPAGAGSDLTRPDNSVLGVPPELAVIPGIGVGRAILGEAGGMASRAYAGAKAAVDQAAAPVAKYELTRGSLEALGISPAIAIPIAIAVSGYRRGARAPDRAPAAGAAGEAVSPASIAAEAPAASSASQVASPRAVPAPQAVPEVPPSAPTRAGVPESSPGPKLSTQRIRNEVGLAEKRAGLKLTEGQREQADRLVAQGQSPKEAVQAVAEPATAPPMTTSSAPQSPAASTAPARARMTAAEVKEYQRMIQAGKTPKEAQEAIELQRQFAQQYKTQSVEQAFRKRDVRNATGRWPKDD